MDPEAAKQSPFGGTIAHGFLVMSMLSVMLAEAMGEIEGVSTSVNYGFDSVRFISPVKSGARIRARFTMSEATERAPGQWRVKVGTTIEIEGSEKPAAVAD